MTRFDEVDFHLDLSAAQQSRRIGELEAGRNADRQVIIGLQDQLTERDLAYHRLEGAIATARTIGAAVGIVMALMKMTQDEAFGTLTVISQRQNRKLRLVADDIVLTGTF